MNKILTVSIAAYNVEDYLVNCLNSIVDSSVKDKLEVFVVDDGGTDNSLIIAQKYEKQFPGIVHAIHKENGGYGSVQNYSIKNATGKYFKILDGDDWFSKNGLEQLVGFLQESDADVVVTNYYKGDSPDHLVNMEVGKSCTKNKLLKPDQIKDQFGMWTLTYKTEVLRQSGLELPSHTLYTDRIYSTIPFGYVSSVVVLDYYVYCYRIGRDGQSVSRESRIKHVNEYLETTRTLLLFYKNGNFKNKRYLLNKISNAYMYSVRVLFLLPITKKNQRMLMDYEREAKSIAPDIFNKTIRLKTKTAKILKLIRQSKYQGYWMLKLIPKNIFDF